MNNTFEEAFVFLMKQEGGWVDNAHDNGGATKYGISKRSYPHINIRELTVSQAKAIYLKDFWDRNRLSDCDSGVALTVFDAGVNSGVGTGAKWLQRAAGFTVCDGQIGPKTLKKVQQCDPYLLIERVNQYRHKLMRGHEDWNIMKNGWTDRVIEVSIVSAKWTANNGCKRDQVQAGSSQGLLSSQG